MPKPDSCVSAETPRILMMRHPETLANVIHFLSGRRDVDLTPEGERQRERALEALQSWRPDRILTSPLTRCRNIAEPVAQALGVPCQVDERLYEIEFGTIEGLTHEQMVAAGYSFPWPITPEGISCPAPGAESFEHLTARARDLAGSLVGLTGRTACVTHGGFTRGFMAAVYNADVHEFWHISVANVSSQVFSVADGKLYLEAFGLTPEEVEQRMACPDGARTINARGVY